MSTEPIYAFVAEVVGSMVSLIGVLTVANSRLSPERITPYLLSLVAGALSRPAHLSLTT